MMINLKNTLLKVAMVFIAISLSACSNHQVKYDVAAEPEVVSSLKRYTSETLIAPGDQIEVFIYKHPDISRTVIVRADGFISLPLLDEIKVVGLTMLELDDLLTEKLSMRLKKPEVTVILTNPQEPMVYLFGDVGITKPIPLRQVKTMASALAYGGGITRDADIREVALVRLDDDGYIRMRRLKGNTDGPIGPYMAYMNMSLQADDLIVVPEANRSLARRFIQDFILQPVTAITSVWSLYYQNRILRILLENQDVSVSSP